MSKGLQKTYPLSPAVTCMQDDEELMMIDDFAVSDQLWVRPVCEVGNHTHTTVVFIKCIQIGLAI